MMSARSEILRRRMVRTMDRIDLELAFLTATIATVALAGAAAWLLRGFL